MAKIILNGQETEVQEGISLLSILEQLKLPSLKFGIAAALNSEVVDSENWETTKVRNGDSVEVIRAFQGG